VESGWAILRVEDRREEQPIGLDEARPQIVRFLTYDQIRDLLEKLRGRSKVELLVKTQGPKPVPPADAAPATVQPQPQPQAQGAAR